MEKCKKITKYLCVTLVMAVLLSFASITSLRAYADSTGKIPTTGSYVYFGSYPNARVTDSKILEKLNQVTAPANAETDFWIDGTKYRKIYTNNCNNTENTKGTSYAYFEWKRIKWRVLEVDQSSNSMLLISDEGLDCRKLNSTSGSITWNNSYLKNWLTGTDSASFVNTAFSRNYEAKDIIENSGDKVICLSKDDIQTYGVKNVGPSDFSFYKGAVKDSNYGYLFWTSTVINSEQSAEVIGYYNNNTRTQINDDTIMVVPAIRIKLDSKYWLPSDSKQAKTSGMGGENKYYSIEYKLWGGTLPDDYPKGYSTEKDLECLPDFGKEFVTDNRNFNDYYQDPTKEKYRFEGWYTDIDYINRLDYKPIDGNITLYAKWKGAKYKLQYCLDGEVLYTSYYIYEEGFLNFWEPDYFGFTFDGWYWDKQLSQKVQEVSDSDFGDLTIYGKTTPYQYNITYVLNGGTNSAKNPAVYYYSKGLDVLYTPTKDWHKFAGWYESNTFEGEPVTSIPRKSTGDITLYANWYGFRPKTDYEDNGMEYVIERDKNGKVTYVTLRDCKKYGGSVLDISTIKFEGEECQIDEVANQAFDSNKNNKFTSLIIGDSVKKIGVCAFSDCPKLKKVKIGNGITTISKEAFCDNKKLTSVTFGANVKKIDNEAFANCIKLDKVTLGSKIATIGSKAFYNCKGLKNITIKSTKLTAKKVGAEAFSKISAKAKVKVPKNKVAAYKKILIKKGLNGKKQKVVK